MLIERCYEVVPYPGSQAIGLVGIPAIPHETESAPQGWAFRVPENLATKIPDGKQCQTFAEAIRVLADAFFHGDLAKAADAMTFTGPALDPTSASVVR